MLGAHAVAGIAADTTSHNVCSDVHSTIVITQCLVLSSLVPRLSVGREREPGTRLGAQLQEQQTERLKPLDVYLMFRCM